jgi:hypothetical protein
MQRNAGCIRADVYRDVTTYQAIAGEVFTAAYLLDFPAGWRSDTDERKCPPAPTLYRSQRLAQISRRKSCRQGRKREKVGGVQQLRFNRQILRTRIAPAMPAGIR